ncbi:cupin domain-containing protein [Ensifer adhaerens]|uniref:cupin domain-containing protein n=1 Tax=Ensifer adhaerens TaxID=106592 RepID=UPI001CBE426A|nr:cupin domain-containing protein [Ensifer adhaerens]MBZ7924939.1 cupin domain-containing protein [Ensifer adhaerens]UAX95850.1 cupin domain-containing protein [Ensifer adhaerens]UAY04808.1 cupin domain-containing protein [Ensifer adhaerens]UAY10239.1 cupin domain-containing protein [Ensifer adhaerens]
MNDQPDRTFSTDRIQRARATTDAKRQAATWTKWESGMTEPFEIHYDRAVSFCVVEGRGEIRFTDGTQLDIQRDDFVTIHPEIRGVWTVLEPITNLYMWHDTKPMPVKR